VFVHGTELDRYFETADGVIWVSALVEVQNGTLMLDQMLFYPATGTRLTIGVGQVLSPAIRRRQIPGFRALRFAQGAE
jgi:hypothetical protein